MFDKPDVQFGRGPFGKLHVRFGKSAKTSGPRPRWVPMLDNLDLVPRWFLDDVRGRFPASPVLFCDESGGRMAAGTIRNRCPVMASGNRSLGGKALAVIV